MKKFPVLCKLNAAFPTSYLQQQLLLWGVKPDEVPQRAADVLTAVNRHLEDKLQLRAKKLKVYFFAVSNKLYLLNSSPPLEANNPAWIDLEVKGLGALNKKLGDDPKNWDRFVFTVPEFISDPIARLQAEDLSNPLKFENAFKIERKSSFDMSNLTTEDEKDSVCDALLDEGSFMYGPGDLSQQAAQESAYQDAQSAEFEDEKPTFSSTNYTSNVENLTQQAGKLQVNTFSASEVLSTKDIRIQRFDPDKMDAQTWTGNQVYELEMSGLKNEKKMIAKLLSGLPDELRYAVRTDLQQNYPKIDGEYGGTVAEFLTILKTHAMQTTADMMESLSMLRLGNNKDLRKFYYQVKSLVDATLTTKQRDSGVSELIATAKFREKLPNYLRNNQLIASSTESGLKLVGLAQRVMNRCKHEGVEANTFQSSSGKGWKGKKDGRFNKKWKKKEGDDKSKGERKSGMTCDFCGLDGHKMDTCYAFTKAKKLRREEIEKRGSNKNK